MIELSTSRMHVAILLDRLHAADHHQIVGRWPSLLVVTENASLQLDPAPRLTRAGDAYLQPPAARGRTLGRVHPPLRRRDTGDEGRPRGRTGTDLR